MPEREKVLEVLTGITFCERLLRDKLGRTAAIVSGPVYFVVAGKGERRQPGRSLNENRLQAKGKTDWGPRRRLYTDDRHFVVHLL